MSANTGFVYVIQMEGHDIFKIGRSNDMTRRMSQFGVQLPFPFVVRFARKVQEPTQIEGVLHECFALKRLNGEWFQLTDRDVDAISLSLLLYQAHELADHLRESFAAQGSSHPPTMIRYGRLFQLAGRRIRRRKETIARLAIVKRNEIVDAGVIG